MKDPQKKLGIPDKMFRVAISFHQGLEAAVTLDCESSDLFTITNGVVQGYCGWRT